MPSVLWLLALLAPAPSAAQLVVLDPGHGGTDPGAVGCSLEEADVVLDVASRLATLLETAGVTVTMTRDTDVFVGLSARAALANDMGADVFVSNHSNSNAGTPASGTETWIANAASARSLTLAEGLQAAMIEAWALPDRGVKRADFVVVRDTSMPAALAELAFTNRCSPDAELLGDPAARQRLAEAEAAAILAWLGIGPSGGDGVARGVVFEDQGVGTEDVSVRLPGAVVRVVETGAMTTAAAGDAAWSFDLPAGTYTLEASADGHTTETRTCTVASGGTSWCSLGLFPSSAIDAGVSDDAGTAPTDVGGSDAGAPDAGTIAPAASCGCRASSTGSASVWPVIFVALVLAARRRGVLLLARHGFLLALLFGCASPEAIAAPATLVERGIVRPTVVASIGIDARTPILSDDGAALLVPSADGARLDHVSLRDGARTLLAVGPRVGIEPRFQPDGSIAYRGPEDSSTAVPSHAVGLDGQPRPVLLHTHGVHAWVERGEGEDRVLYRDGHATRSIAGGDRYLLPSLSAAGWLAYWGAETGVVAVELATDHRLRVGDPLLEAGTFGHPRFDGSGRFLVLERTEDDGHDFTAGELRVIDLGSSPARTFVIETTGIARQPSLSRMVQRAEGWVGRLAWIEDHEVRVGEITLPR